MTAKKKTETITKPASKAQSSKKKTNTNCKRTKAARKRKADVSTPTASTPTKIQILVNSLSSPGGATIKELTEATGWLPHSVRGALAGVLKKKGHDIRSEKIDGVRRYSIGDTAT